MLCLLLRYVSLKGHKLVTTFYRLIRLEDKTAESITRSICEALSQDKLDIQNLVGLGMDGAATLTRTRTGASLIAMQFESVVQFGIT
uniref:DUF4371 domain-containing protein n=1 Tax=Romanomermis culicivorax TaxID=13658 RepID=A0A915K942_ROMCU